MHVRLLLNFVLVLGLVGIFQCQNTEPEFLALTVATDRTDGFLRYKRSVERLHIPYKVLGGDEEWRGGDVRRSPGGGHKVNLLAAELSQYRDREDIIILFTDSYDVVVDRGIDYILRQFRSTSARVVFSAESACWPDPALADQYPSVPDGKPFLNSGGFIGYASDLYQLVTVMPIADEQDDQLFFTRLYLNETLRQRHRMKLDHTSTIFLNLNGALDEVSLRFDEGEEKELFHLYNTVHQTSTAVIHGNGPTKMALNSLANYLAGARNSQQDCLVCQEDLITLSEDVPSVCVSALFVRATPFSDEFLSKLLLLDYPASALFLYIFSLAEYHDEQLIVFTEQNRDKFSSIHLVLSHQLESEAQARNAAVDHCITSGAEYMLSLDSSAHLDNPKTLRLLIEQNRDVIAPLLLRPSQQWSNFWGALSQDGFYARSFDYLSIVNGTYRGVFNVPYISECYLLKAEVLNSAPYRPQYQSQQLDPDMAMCNHMLEEGKFMYVTNLAEFGSLVVTDQFDGSRAHAELWQMGINHYHWQQRYIHVDYQQTLNSTSPVLMPCPDVYWFPVFSERFCDELVSTMELHGRWSDGSNQDERLDGGYENVPTRDIHMNQIGFEREWLAILDYYLRPLQEKVFVGYHHSPPRAIMNFVVRYRPDEQPSLRAHHDSSTYTVNVALNHAGTDYQGGGARFIRYDCEVKDTRKGWTLMHPGRLTHYHEGLTTTEGTRYILVSFVDP